MTAVLAVTHRLVVVAPDQGWLTLTEPRSGRAELGNQWIDATASAARAAGLPALGRVRIRIEARPDKVAFDGPGIRRAEDVRPTVHRVGEGLEEAGVLAEWNPAAVRQVLGEELILGTPTGPAGGRGYLIITFTEVDRG